MNIYHGCRTADELLELTYSFKENINTKRIREDKRPLNDANIIAAGIIFKPDVMLMKSLTFEEQVQFLSDCVEWLVGKVGAKNILATAMHFDETNPHIHTFYLACDKNGNWIGSKIGSLPFLGSLNREFPSFMRDKGWPVSDPFDYLKLKQYLGDEMYEEYMRNPRYKCGRQSFQFKAEADVEKWHIEECIRFLREIAKEKECEIVKLESDIAGYRRAHDFYAEMTTAKKSESEVIISHISHGISELTNINDELAKRKAMLDEQEKLKADRESQIRALNDELERLRREISQKHSDLEKYKDMLCHLSEQVADAKSVIAAGEKLTAREEEYMRRISQLEKERDDEYLSHMEDTNRFNEALGKISERYDIPIDELNELLQEQEPDVEYPRL